MEEQKNSASKKRPLNLDWAQILGQNDTDPPPSLVIVKQNDIPKPSPSPPMTSSDHDYSHMSDRELHDSIKRIKGTIGKFSATLPDGGAKLRASLESQEEELWRREERKAQQMDVEVLEKPTSSTKSDNQMNCSFKRGNAKPEVHSRSKFGSIFCQKIEENTDCSEDKAFDKELSMLGHRNGTFLKTTSNDRSYLRKGSQKRLLSSSSSSSRQHFKSAASLSRQNRGDKQDVSNGYLKDRASANPFSQNGGSVSSNFFKKNDDCRNLPSTRSRRRKEQQSIVCLDGDEDELGEAREVEEILPDCSKDTKIYYSSRDDQKKDEVSYKDLDCLAPEALLSSSIMNFYIWYLQQQTSPTNKAISDCHFFNTFFYNKLKQAVSHTGNDQEFIKFRRWWKDVNLFEKAYVLIPIHDELHWSLVIISIPDKEDESGPIILHLDSLGLHSSRTIFKDIRSFLVQEWKCKKQVSSLDIPIAEQIWKNLPKKIEERRIQVPQQRNDFDCGIFVLFFMKRFIEEAPERLKKKDLSMFGKRWFEPEEASDLRGEIKKILLDEFRKVEAQDRTSESSNPSSTVALPVG